MSDRPYDFDKYFFKVDHVRSEGGAVYKLSGEDVYQPSSLGSKLIASHYNEKYDVDIRVLDNIDHLMPAVEQARTIASAEKKEVRIGFSVPDSMDDDEASKSMLEMSSDPDNGFPYRTTARTHRTPVVYIKKENGEECLLVSDSIASKTVYSRLKEHLPEGMTLIVDKHTEQGIQGARQADDYSCVVDSLTFLRDALREEDLVESMREPTPVANPEGKAIVSALLPANLLKGTQYTPFIAASGIDASTAVLTNTKPTSGPKTLAQKRAKYRQAFAGRDVSGRGATKEFSENAYLYKKAHKLAAIVEKIVTGSTSEEVTARVQDVSYPLKPTILSKSPTSELKDHRSASRGSTDATLSDASSTDLSATGSGSKGRKNYILKRIKPKVDLSRFKFRKSKGHKSSGLDSSDMAALGDVKAKMKRAGMTAATDGGAVVTAAKPRDGSKSLI
jgi:hypothetical protein